MRTKSNGASSATRPILRYHGGKWKLAPWILQFFPAHRVYVEPYGGGGSVLVRKPRSYGEVYNDLDGEIVRVFQVLRDPRKAKELCRLLILTPFARVEFEACYEKKKRLSEIEAARRTILKSFAGFGSSGIHSEKPKGMRTSTRRLRPLTGFRACSTRSGTTPSHDWCRYPQQVERFCERLAGVIIENRPALQVIKTHDAANVLHYVDPPYPSSTRGRCQGYAFEMTDGQHRDLAQLLHCVKGMVVLSGYPCDLYDKELYPDWQRFERPHLADGARKRTEVLWLNPAAAAGITQSSLDFTSHFSTGKEASK